MSKRKIVLPLKVHSLLKTKLMIIIVVGIIAITAGASFAILSGVSRDLPQISSLKNYKPPSGTQIFSEDDHVIGRIKVDKGIFVPISNMPVGLRNAVVAVEDARFYEHKGIDYQGIARAILKDIASASFKEGGSTITQQLTKVLFLTPEKSLSRKVKEVILAKRIEQNLTKNEIIELYLNKIYFGHGAYGVEMAARTYFGKHVGDLTLAECAMVAGLIRSPMGYSPYNNMENAKNREATVLARMVDEKFITEGQKRTAQAQTIVLKNLREREEVAPHLVEQIRIYLEQKYGAEKVYVEGLNVKTTINYQIQQAAQRAVENGVRALDKRQGFRGPVAKKTHAEIERMKDDPPAGENTYKPGEILNGTVLKVDAKGAFISARGAKGYLAFADMKWAATGKDAAKKAAKDILSPGYMVELKSKGYDKKARLVSFTLEQEPLSQAALVAIDPWEGKVKAIVGGSDFQRNEFNHAVNAHRQPGSSFKPFVYAVAMENGFTPASVIDDSPKSYDNDSWKPQNYDHEYYGPTRLREALVHSRNVVTIDLLHQVGVDKVMDLAGKLGMPGPFARDLTLALGSGSVTPQELTAAYCSFANGGYSVKPIVVRQITDARGNVLEDNETQVEQAYSPETAYQITSILEDAVKRGTGQLATSLGRPVAGKTGTTNDYKDAWFVGYIPGLVAGVWVGNDNQKTLGHGESGSRAALPIWVRFMGEATGGYSPDDFTVPNDIDVVTVDAATGLLPTGKSKEVIAECFKKGSEPHEYAAAPATDLGIPDKLMPAIKDIKKLQDID